MELNLCGFGSTSVRLTGTIYEKTLENTKSFYGPIEGGFLQIDADDNVSWTITIEKAG